MYEISIHENCNSFRKSLMEIAEPDGPNYMTLKDP